METNTVDTTEERREAVMMKVAKLMDKAASATKLGNLAEAEAFTLGVGRLMAEYNLTEWEINKNRPEVVSAFKIENTSASRINYDDYNRPGRPGGRWPLDLMKMLCPNFMCDLILHTKAKNMTLFGTSANIKTVQYVFTFLDNLLPQLALQAWKDQTAVANRYQYMRNWIAGAIHGLNSKLYNERKEREAASNSETGLMLFNKEALMTAKNEAFPKARVVKDKKLEWNDAQIAGFHKGKTIQINKALEGTAATEVDTKRLRS
jgi:hypothetical protein